MTKSDEGEKAESNAYDGYKFDVDRVEVLFKKLDVNRDGRVNAEELGDGLKKLGVKHLPGQAEQIIEIGDQTDDDHLSFDEFIKYCHDHEKKLWLVFKSIDKDGSGSISADEFKGAFKNLGVNVKDEEVDRLMKCMDRDGSLKVDWNEWRDFHLLNPHAHNMKEIIRFWRHSTSIDIGDDMVIPDDFTEEEIVSGKWWRQLVAGGLAGVVSRTCTAPLDRIKVMLQVQAGSKESSGIRNVLMSMLKEGGVKSLWRGNGVNVIKIAPETAIKFMAYEKMKRLFLREGEQLRVWERLIAGSLAGVASQTSIYPMELLKTRLAIGKTGQYKGIFHAAKSIYMQEGLRTFYKGLQPSLLGIIPYAGIDLAIYETLKMTWLKRHQSESADPGVSVLLICGTVSSTCGQLASYPLALVRTKLQAQGVNSKSGMGDVFRTIIRENGFFGLYRGLAPNVMKVAPAVSISYVVYERLKSVLGISSC